MRHLWTWRLIWTGLTLLFMTSYVYGQAVTSSCDGLPVVDIQVDGCEQGPCSPQEVKDNVVAVARDALGPTYSDTHLQAAIQRLGGLGFFVKVEAICAIRAGGAHVRFVGEPNRIVREMKIRGNEQFYVDEIRKRVFLRKGTLLAPGSEDTEAQIRRQEETLENLYEREGLVGSEVQ